MAKFSTTEEFEVRIRLIMALTAVVLGAVACDQAEQDPAATTNGPAAVTTGDGTTGAFGHGTDESLSELAVGPDGWTRKINRPQMGAPFFAELLGQETAEWVEGSWTSSWSESDQGPHVLVWVFRFDTAAHAERVWQELRGVDGFDERYVVEGVPDTHVAVSAFTETPGSLHEAYRLVGKHLVVFTFTEGSDTERPDPTLERVVRHHATEFEPSLS